MHISRLDIDGIILIIGSRCWISRLMVELQSEAHFLWDQRWNSYMHSAHPWWRRTKNNYIRKPLKLICMAKFSSSIYLTRISRKINVIKEWLRSLRVRMNPHEEWNIGRACKCSFDKGGFECSYLSNRCAHAIILHHDEACYRIWWSMLSKGLDLRWRTWRIENLIVITHNYY